MRPMVGEEGRVRIWVVLVVVVVGLGAITTRDLWWPASEMSQSEHTQSGLENVDLETYEGTTRFALARADQQDSLAAIWEEELVPRGIRFRNPSFRKYDAENPPYDPCTKDQKDWTYKDRAYYCSQTQTIYWDDEYLKDLFEKYGYVQTMLLFAHEWGHHVSFLRGDRTTFSIQEELQADCFSGMYFRRAFRAMDLDLSSNKVRSAAAEWFHRGDRADTSSPWFKAGLHGRSWQRASVFSLGFSLDNLHLCERLQGFGRRDTGRVGPILVPVVDGSDIETVDRGYIRITSDQGKAEVRYLETKPDTSLSRAYQRYREAVTEGGGGLSDVQLQPLTEGASSNPSSWLSWYQFRYERSQVRNGGSETFHGVALLGVLENGGMVAFDTRTAGPAVGVDDASWQRMAVYVTQLYNGTAWEFG